ncbi:MAG: LysR family transcriptional regulator, partial [Hyphomicrobiales bacterium]|nr:LysR family transcriptional regulator [Hyphomicrobiales bacterium]
MIIRQLAYLDALARERHFRKAAEACNVSQPTLSAAIAQLEREFGAQLVARGRRFEGLTREGEAVLAHARRVLAEVDAMGDALAELREGIGGRLTIGAVPTALPMIAGVTAPFLARYPGVALTILSQTSVEIQRGLDAFEIDVGLTYLDNEPLERVVSKPIYVEGYLLLTRADGPLASRDEIGWAEAARLRLCLLTPDMQNRRIVDGTFRSVGAAPVPVME